jgi:ribosome-binding protein aMBF1 (putative translation factor)
MQKKDSLTVLWGLIVKQAREQKGWTQQTLADQMGRSLEDIRQMEEGNVNPDVNMLGEYGFLLDISLDIYLSAETAETVLQMDRIFRDLLTLTPYQIESVCKCAKSWRSQKDDTPDLHTLEDFWSSRSTQN